MDEEEKSLILASLGDQGPVTCGVGLQVTVSPDFRFDLNEEITINTEESDYVIIKFNEEEEKEDGEI